MKRCVLVSMIFFFAAAPGFAKLTKPIPFRKGAVVNFEIAFPQQGFAGAPPSASPFPPSSIKPTKPEHFERRLIRVTFVEESTRTLDGGKGRCIALRLDEVDKEEKIIVETLYLANIEITTGGTRIHYGSNDGSMGGEDMLICYGIPFPFTCARPPALGPAKTDRDGFLDQRRGRGAEYVRKASGDASGGVRVEVTRIENPQESENGRRELKWYKSGIADLVKDKKTRILYREKQKWAKPDDWFWEEMERFDIDGNLLIRAKRVH